MCGEIDDELFNALYADLSDTPNFVTDKPLLAHYTSIGVVETILRNREIWLANPLFMNDHEEVRWGILVGVDRFLTSEAVRSACASPDDFEILCQNLTGYRDQYGGGAVIDTFVFSLSRIQPDDNDGLLSMWRGYGGNGSGAAIVFDTCRLELNMDSPFLIDSVHYASADERIRKIDQFIQITAEAIARHKLDRDNLHIAAWRFFDRLKIFALFTKHVGFQEECEWRVVYLPERDVENLLTPMIDYFVGPNGVEPKLKFSFDKGIAAIGGTSTFESLVDKIILGPTASSPLSQAGFSKIVQRVAPFLADKVFASTIPYRTRL